MTLPRDAQRRPAGHKESLGLSRSLTRRRNDNPKSTILYKQSPPLFLLNVSYPPLSFSSSSPTILLPLLPSLSLSFSPASSASSVSPLLPYSPISLFPSPPIPSFSTHTPLPFLPPPIPSFLSTLYPPPPTHPYCALLGHNCCHSKFSSGAFQTLILFIGAWEQNKFVCRFLFVFFGAIFLLLLFQTRLRTRPHTELYIYKPMYVTIHIHTYMITHAGAHRYVCNSVYMYKYIYLHTRAKAFLWKRKHSVRYLDVKSHFWLLSLFEMKFTIR